MYLLQHDIDKSNPNDHFIADVEEPADGWKSGTQTHYFSGTSTEPSSLTIVPLPHYDVDRWTAIKAALEAIATSRQLSFEELRTHMRSYASPTLDLSGLESLLAGEANSNTLHELIPKISRLALSLPQLIPMPVPLLRSNSTSSVTLSQRQAASLLANAFFCTFDEGVRRRRRYNTINFKRLFARYKSSPCAREEKLKCLMCYFASVLLECVTFSKNVVTISRTTRADVPDWSGCDGSLAELDASAEGTIESGGVGMAQVDFANRFIGGGVLRRGCLQEEIRFITCPEMLISCLVCEKMESRDAIRIVGAGAYSDYKGYSRNFKWIGKSEHEGEHPGRDGHGRLRTELIAMDALPFLEKSRQYKMELVNRELDKAFVGFSIVSSESPSRIATGNWGCGAFNGDVELKSLIQLMAASAAGRPISYFTFGNVKLAEDLNEVVGLMLRRGTTIGHLYTMISEFCSLTTEERMKGLFVHIRRCVTSTACI